MFGLNMNRSVFEIKGSCSKADKINSVGRFATEYLSMRPGLLKVPSRHGRNSGLVGSPRTRKLPIDQHLACLRLDNDRSRTLGAGGRTLVAPRMIDSITVWNIRTWFQSCILCFIPT